MTENTLSWDDFVAMSLLLPTAFTFDFFTHTIFPDE